MPSSPLSDAHTMLKNFENLPIFQAIQDRIAPPVQLWEGREEDTAACAHHTAHVLFKSRPTQHPNYFLLASMEDKRDITLEATRHLLDFLHTTPSLPGVRFVYIPNAHTLNMQSANALLKIFEDTPKDVYIVLATHNAKLIPVTLRSRCLCITFAAKQAPQDAQAFQQVGKLLLMMYAQTPKVIAPHVHALNDEEAERLLRGLLPLVFKVTQSFYASANDISAGIQKLCAAAPLKKWMDGYDACLDYLHCAENARIPLKDQLLSALYLMHTPSFGRTSGILDMAHIS